MFQLINRVPSPVVSELIKAVRTRGMRPFMNHETISKEIFSMAYSSGTGTISSWEGALTNLDDGQHTLATKMISAYYCFFALGVSWQLPHADLAKTTVVFARSCF